MPECARLCSICITIRQRSFAIQSLIRQRRLGEQASIFAALRLYFGLYQNSALSTNQYSTGSFPTSHACFHLEQ